MGAPSLRTQLEQAIRELDDERGLNHALREALRRITRRERCEYCGLPLRGPGTCDGIGQHREQT